MNNQYLNFLDYLSKHRIYKKINVINYFKKHKDFTADTCYEMLEKMLYAQHIEFNINPFSEWPTEIIVNLKHNGFDYLNEQRLKISGYQHLNLSYKVSLIALVLTAISISYTAYSQHQNNQLQKTVEALSKQVQRLEQSAKKLNVSIPKVPVKMKLP